MKELTVRVEYCPKGHGDFTIIPASTMYYEVMWCDKCDCFYELSLKKKTKENINKDFSSDRAKDLVDYARFIKWKSGLKLSDMPPFQHV